MTRYLVSLMGHASFVAIDYRPDDCAPGLTLFRLPDGSTRSRGPGAIFGIEPVPSEGHVWNGSHCAIPACHARRLMASKDLPCPTASDDADRVDFPPREPEPVEPSPPEDSSDDTFMMGPHRFYHDPEITFCVADECIVRRTDAEAASKSCPWDGKTLVTSAPPIEAQLSTAPSEPPAFDDECPF